MQRQTSESSMAKYSLVDYDTWYSQRSRRRFIKLGTFIDSYVFVGINGHTIMLMFYTQLTIMFFHRYTMTKSTTIIFILGFSLIFKLEKKVKLITLFFAKGMSEKISNLCNIDKCQ